MKFQPLLGHVYIVLTIILTVYGQIVLKWRMNMKGPPPDGFVQMTLFLLRSLCDVYIISTYVAALLASLAWMAAMTKFEVSYAYPFLSLSFVLVLILGALVFGESITTGKVIGMVLIAAGIVLASR